MKDNGFAILVKVKEKPNRDEIESSKFNNVSFPIEWTVCYIMNQEN